MLRKHVLILVTIIVSCVFLVLPVVAASSFIDFENAALGTPASALSYPGVSFSGGTWFVVEPGPVTGSSELIGICGGSLTISFSTVQTGVSFQWASVTFGLRVDAFLDGVLVSTQTFAGPWGSSVNITGSFNQITVDDNLGGGCAAIDNLSYTGSQASTAFSDGRINRYDRGTPVVLYPIDYGSGQRGLHVYNADKSGLLFEVTPEQIAAVAECPESNTTIAQDAASGIIFSRLTARAEGVCPFQLNAPTGQPGKDYVVIFYSLTELTHYESFETYGG